MARELGRIQPGWNVYGSDGAKVGDVAEVGTNYVLVQKGWLFTRDIYIPLSAITSVDEDRVSLNMSKDQIEAMDWDTVPMEDTGAATYGTTATSTMGMRDTAATTVTGTDYAATSNVRETRSTVDSGVMDTSSSVART